MNLQQTYKQHPYLSTLVLMIIAGMAILIVFSIFTRIVSLHGQEYETPDLTGMTQTEINEYINHGNKHNFRLEIIDSMFLPQKTPGTVLNQDPMPGSKIKKNRKIYITTVAYTAPKVEMPNLLDLSLRQAENMLTSNHLKLGQVIYKESKFNNAVLEQRYKGRIIQAGKQVPYESSITLIVGKDPNTLETLAEE